MASRQPTLTELIRQIHCSTGGMRTTGSLAAAFDIPETAIAPLAAQARDLGLITTERDPRTMSPMHRLTEAGRRRVPPRPRSIPLRPAHRLAAQLDTGIDYGRSVTATAARDQYRRAVQAEDAELRVILSPAYLDWVLGHRATRP